MKVREVIEKLQEFDPDMDVVIWADDGKPDILNVGRIQQVRIDYTRANPTLWDLDSDVSKLVYGVIII